MVPRKGAVRPLMRRCYKGVRRLPVLAGAEACASALQKEMGAFDKGPHPVHIVARNA